jgi:tetratricopeptide (TPR) repeat protein
MIEWLTRENTRIRYLVCTGCALLLLSGCASRPAQDAPAALPEAAQEAEIKREPTDEEVMYRVFAAEYLGAEGDLEAAVGEYLEAAMISDDPEIARRATRVAFAAQAWQQAAMASDRWAVLQPESIAAHESAALAMLALGDYAGAEFQILSILNLMDGSTEAWLLVSNLLNQSADPNRADEILSHVLESRGEGEHAEALYARSQMAARSNDFRRAFELARQAVELKPDRIEFLTWTGRLALNLRLPETGLEYVRRAWQLDQENHDLTLAYADLLARNGREEDARRVMAEMPQTPDVMLSRILFEIAAKRPAAADKLYAEFNDSFFDDEQEKVFYQAQAAEALGRMNEAIDLYGQVKSGDRALAAAVRIAELRAMEGDLEGARSELARLRLQNNRLIVEESWLAEARILRELGMREEAFDVLSAALNSVPESISVLYTHALLAAELGWVDIAEADLRTVISAQPENAAALNALGYTLADQTERFEEAEALIRQAYILAPDEPSIIDSMGWIAYRLGRLDEAIEFLERAWKLDRNPEIAAHLGEVLWVDGRPEEALAIWREGQAVDDENPVLVETLERLGVDP